MGAYVDPSVRAEPDEPDFGTDGAAARARPSMIIRVGGEHRSSTRSEAVEARRYSDATLFDRMNARGQLSDTQHEAAARLASLWMAGGFYQRTTGRYDELRGRAIDAGAEDADGPDHLLRSLLAELPSRQAWALTGLMSGQHPGLRLSDLQAALDALADA